MVARMHGVHEVAGSSPVTQTSNIKGCRNTTLLFLDLVGEFGGE